MPVNVRAVDRDRAQQDVDYILPIRQRHLQVPWIKIRQCSFRAPRLAVDRQISQLGHQKQYGLKITISDRLPHAPIKD